MAYTNDEFRVEITGNGTSGEVWSNTWSARDNEGSQDPQDFVDILHEFYTDLFGFAVPISNDTSAVRAVIRNLGSGLVTEGGWGTLTGAGGGVPLPTQLAIRVSLSAGLHRGGPYLTGFTVGVVDTDSTLTVGFKSDLIGALETMFASLDSAQWSLCIDRPTSLTMQQVTACRIGDRFDVIRKRANDIAEAYAAVTI